MVVKRKSNCWLAVVLLAVGVAEICPGYELRRPGVGADHLWSPYDDRYQLLPKSWIDDEKYTSQLAFRAPLLAAFGDGGTNVLSLSCSETFRKVSLGISLGESDCNLRCFAKFFAEPEAPLRHYDRTFNVFGRPVESREIAEGVAFVAVPRSGFAEIR